jgi:hypothetical protein
MQPPELEGPGGQLGWPAFFPTEHSGSGAANSSPDSVILALKPGHGVILHWAPRSGKANPGDSLLKSTDWRPSFLRYLSFTPGDYPISVQAKYWTNPTLPRLDYRTAGSTLSLHVLAPQGVILFGSAIGGLIAYLIFPGRRTRRVVRTTETDSKTQVTRVVRSAVTVGKHVFAALGAMLWSAIVAILLSRLAQTDFLIKVTVADFWGAIATGFVAQYAGARWLEWLVRPQATEEEKGKRTTKDRTAEGGRDPDKVRESAPVDEAGNGRTPVDEIDAPDFETEPATSGQR